MNREGETPKVSIGFVTGLDYTDARLSVHDVLQEFKLHPLVQEDPRGRQARRLGREGDPRGRLLGDAARCTRPGMVICGDAGGMVNVPQAQGHPLRDPSPGMLAAETIYRQLKAGSTDFSAYEDGDLRRRRSARSSTSRAT